MAAEVLLVVLLVGNVRVLRSVSTRLPTLDNGDNAQHHDKDTRVNDTSSSSLIRCCLWTTFNNYQTTGD